MSRRTFPVNASPTGLLWQTALRQACLAATSRQSSARPGAQVARCLLPAHPIGVGLARTFVRTRLARQSLPHVGADIELVVSELVTNALRHGLPGAPAPLRRRHPQFLVVHMDECLMVAVTDPVARPPAPCQPDSIMESGRGLHLVEALSDAWGWIPLTGPSKMVWAGFSS